MRKRRIPIKNIEVGIKIPGFSNYSITDKGQIRLTKSKRKMRPSISKKGYSLATLISDKGERRTIGVHRLVMLTYVGPSDLTVDHIDGNKLNNILSNLEYVTIQENIRRYYKNKLN